MVDSSGNLTSSTSYDSYGNATGNLDTRYQFTGREYDDLTELHYYRARFYDGKLGRFISEDPIGFAGGDVNLYGYIWNNPQQFTDPMGLDGWGNDSADYLDEKIDVAEDFYGVDPTIGYSAIGQKHTLFGTLRGLTDMLRIGSGAGDAYYKEDENIYGRGAFIAMDVARGSGLFTIMAGFACRINTPNRHFSGTTKPWTKGATPNSIYTHINPKTGKAVQNAAYNGKGKVMGHVDYKNHGRNATSGHGHKFSRPGDPSSGHGRGNPHIPYNKLPKRWRKLPKGVQPHTPIGN